jgi:hypothetical protein
MTAREKLQNLTNAWYGFGVVAGLGSILQNGIGFFSILIAIGSTLFSFFLTWFFGRRLLNKSSLTRFLLIIVSALASLFGSLATAKMGWAFLHEWQLSILAQAAMGGASVYMNVRSFRVLTDDSVKAYFG